MNYYDNFHRFIPDSLFFLVPIIDKLVAEDIQPRYLEDEGLFVGKRPPESKSNISRMEHRLLNENEQVNFVYII